jgi:hypothetical protein
MLQVYNTDREVESRLHKHWHGPDWRQQKISKCVQILNSKYVTGVVIDFLGTKYYSNIYAFLYL